MDTIHRVYRLFAARYHPDNQATGDPGRFAKISDAHRILSDPDLRAEYDRQLQDSSPKVLPVFQTKAFTEGLEAESNIRIGILCLLYAKRRANPDMAALSLLDLEQLTAFPREHLQFAIWYLKAKRYIVQDDRSSFIVTADGVDYLEIQLPQNELMLKLFQSAENGVMIYPKALLVSKSA